jgi:hypothetical protein
MEFQNAYQWENTILLESKQEEEEEKDEEK